MTKKTLKQKLGNTFKQIGFWAGGAYMMFVAMDVSATAGGIAAVEIFMNPSQRDKQGAAELALNDYKDSNLAYKTLRVGQYLTYSHELNLTTKKVEDELKLLKL